MAGVSLPTGEVIYTYGQPMTAIHLITKGSVRIACKEAECVLGVGDVIGITEVCSEVHFLECSTREVTQLVTYPISTFDMLQDFVALHPDYARLFIVSAFRQISAMLNKSATNSVFCSNLYSSLREDFTTYENISKNHLIPVVNPSGYEELDAYLAEEAPDYWLYDFYSGLCKAYSGSEGKCLLQDSGISMGMLRKCSLDFRRTCVAIEEQERYVKDVYDFYVNDSGNDFATCLLSLYSNINARDKDSEVLFNLLNRVLVSLQNNEENVLVKERMDTLQEYADKFGTDVYLENAAEEAKKTINSDAELANSMMTILDYSGVEEAFKIDLADSMAKYKNLKDKDGLDEEATGLRRKLARDFITLYSNTYKMTLTVKDIPLPVKMFLYFGYIDEALAGIENASILKTLAQNMDSVRGDNVYTFFDWLNLIYEGKKEPSRNEFDTDYDETIRKKCSESGKKSEYEKMANDTLAKVDFELDNFFPSTNKMTFGRIGSYFPFFTKENALKDLTASLVTARKVTEAFKEIKSIDATAFYREFVSNDTAEILGKLPSHVEYLPNIILMPNMGINGVMWQEIEGKYRNTSARMVFSVFHLEDFYTSLLRSTGEFRWEMCKRIQDSRWNDVSDPSLTSEYFDYVQFYRKNHELSVAAKEKIKTQLQRSKNSFKEMFVRDYLQWMIYEGKGSPRLNKVARKILFTYCPFPASIASKLYQNPLFSEAGGYHNRKGLQQLYILNNIAKKYEHSGKDIPKVLKNELDFYQSICVDA